MLKTIEQRPLSDLLVHPPKEVLNWLYDLNGDDQWVDFEGGRLVGAGLVRGDHIIIWQDEPLTESDREDLASEYEERLGGEYTPELTSERRDWWYEGF